MRNSITKIKTENLLLRILEIADAEDLQKLLARNKEKMLPWIPWAGEEPQPVEVKVEKIIEWRTEFLLNTKYTYGIYTADNDNLIGLIFLFTRQGKGKLEIGYIIDDAQTGKGYATESSYAVTKLGFEELQIPEMVIHCNAKNIASARIPEKLGFQLHEKKREGTTEMLIWSHSLENFSALIQFEPISFIKKEIDQKA